jgi:transcriptional regulator with XRE-family HTH domain
VRAARLRADLTQEELASRADKHVNTIANLEDDTTPPRLTARGWRTVEDVARALRTTPEALGYRLRRRVQTNTLTSEQREVIEDILGLPKEELEAVRHMLRTIEARRGKGSE